MTTSAVDEYLDALDRALRVPARLRRDLLAETRSGLEDAVADLRGREATLDAAQERAVADFGDLHDLARAYGRAAATGALRRTARAILLVVPVQVTVWSVLWATVWGDRYAGGGPSAATLLYLGFGVLGVLSAALVLRLTRRPLPRTNALLVLSSCCVASAAVPVGVTLVRLWAGTGVTTSPFAVVTHAVATVVAALPAGLAVRSDRITRSALRRAAGS